MTLFSHGLKARQARRVRFPETESMSLKYLNTIYYITESIFSPFFL